MNVEKGILRPKIGYLKKKQAYPPECPVLKSRSSVGDACLGLGASKIGINRQTFWVCFNVYIIRFNSKYELKKCFNSTNELK